jgi:hypothetical protein
VKAEMNLRHATALGLIGYWKQLPVRRRYWLTLVAEVIGLIVAVHLTKEPAEIWPKVSIRAVVFLAVGGLMGTGFIWIGRVRCPKCGSGLSAIGPFQTLWIPRYCRHCHLDLNCTR